MSSRALHIQLSTSGKRGEEVRMFGRSTAVQIAVGGKKLNMTGTLSHPFDEWVIGSRSAWLTEHEFL